MQRGRALQAGAAGPALPLARRSRPSACRTTRRSSSRRSTRPMPKAGAGLPCRRAGRAQLRRRSAPTRRSTSSMRSSSTSPTSRADGRKVVVAGWTEGSLDRLAQILAEHHLGNGCKPVDDAGRRRKARSRGRPASPCCRSRPASRPDRFVVVAEQDILGDRLVRRSKKRKRAADFIAEAGVAGGRRPRRPRRSRHRPLHRPEDHRGGRRAARLPRNPLCRRRPALPAGREHRASVALRLRGAPRPCSTGSAAAPGSRARRG